MKKFIAVVALSVASISASADIICRSEYGNTWVVAGEKLTTINSMGTNSDWKLNAKIVEKGSVKSFVFRYLTDNTDVLIDVPVKGGKAKYLNTDSGYTTYANCEVM